MKKLDELTLKIKEVETATERRTKSSKFPSVVPKAAGRGMEKLDDAKKLLADGGMTAENVMKMIPKGTNNSWHGSKTRFDKGFEYEWEGPEPRKSSTTSTGIPKTRTTRRAIQGPAPWCPDPSGRQLAQVRWLSDQQRL